MAPSSARKVAAPNLSPYFTIILSLISLFVCRSSSSCVVGGGKYDFSSLDWLPWNVTIKTVGIPVVTRYQLSLCKPLNAAVPCKDSAICKYSNSATTNVGSYTTEPKFTEDEIRAGFTLHYEGAECGPGRKHKTSIHFHCGTTLGSPSYVYSSSCQTYFKWRTSAACSTASQRKEVPCYVYDNKDQKHDLSFLSYTSGAHYVKSSQSSIGFFINVCSDIGPRNATSPCSPASAACRKIGNEVIDFGRPTSPLSIDKDGNLRLEYVSPSGTTAAGCNLEPRTTITFVCPRKSSNSSVMKQILGPTLVSVAECQYEVEWFTDYACPVEEQVSVSGCMIKDEERGIYADLTVLRKDQYRIQATIDNATQDFYLNVCGGVRMQCSGQSSGSTAVCMNSTANRDGLILGSNAQRKIRIYDGDVTLTYSGGNKCGAEPNSALETIINFRCNISSINSSPTFDRMSDCAYIFEWETPLVCPQTVSAHQCVARNGTTFVDLSILVKQDSSSWDAITSGVPEFANSQLSINVCGSVGTEGLMASCPTGSAVCLKGHDPNSVVSLGRYTSIPQFEGNNVILHYKGGSKCESSNKLLSSVVTFICSPGDTDSGPYLAEVSADKCTFFLEWKTSTACPLSRYNGSNCVIYNKNLPLTFDLTPLQTNGTFHLETEEYDYYLGVCGEISGDPCDKLGNHAACQVSKSNRSRVWSLGSGNSNLQYFDGFVNLTYTGGTPYHDNQKTPRRTTISFLCNPSAGTGKPEFVQEANQIYNFKWYTSLVCPTKPVECVVVDEKNVRQYDLSQLTRSIGQSDWELAGVIKGIKKKFHLNVCHPLVVPGSCSSEVSACEIDVENPKSIINIGQAMSAPFLDSAGKLALKYTLGGKCERGGPNATYEAFIYFMCAEGTSSVEAPKFLSYFGCSYTFLWETSAACPLVDVEHSGDSCRIKDPSSGVVFDLQELRRNYTVATKGDTSFKSFEISLCGAPLSDNCKAIDGANATACARGNSETDTQLLSVSSGAKLEIPQAGKLLVTYQSADSKTVVQIALLCRQDVTKELMKFVHHDASHYYFEMETNVACGPNPLVCSALDKSGNTYDLSTLARSDRNWRVDDTRANHRDLSYYINVCRPLVPLPGTSCTGSTIGACQTTIDPGKSFNLGHVQSGPQVSESGDLTLRYEGGAPCHGGKFQRSTRINFYCSSVQHDPVFIGETEECEYVISWDTPAACSTKKTVGSICSVEDPVYGHRFDFSSLKAKGSYNVTTDEYTYVIGLCHSVSCGSDTSTGVCQIKGDRYISTGTFSDKLVFDNGALSIVYSDGKGNCHGQYNRSTKIQFVCSQKESSGPVFLQEMFNCSYLFLWETPLACIPVTAVECSARDSNGLLYDLSSLALFNSSHEYITPDGAQKFLINVCRSVSSSKVSARCEYTSGVCLMNMTEQERSKKFINLGSVRNSPYFENGILKLKYELGESCSDSHHEVVIAFHCDKSKLESEPTLLKRDGCTWHFVWDTAAACPVNNVDEEKVQNDCKAVNPATGFVYDFSPLKNSSGYIFSDNDEHKFIINVCAPVEISLCDSKTGSCQYKDVGNGNWSAGEANSQVHFHESGLFLNYTDGSKCHGGQFRRSTIIRFICSPDAGRGSPVFLAESDDCTYYVTWHTNLACEKQVHCTVNDGDHIYDLSPLTKTSDHHLALGGEGGEIFLINVCRPLNPVLGIPCPPEAAACQSSIGSSNPLSLGTVDSPPFIDSLGRVVLEYHQGSPCPYNPSTRISTRIIFFCQEGYEEGLPELMHITNECKYIFKWLTSVVCNRNSSTHEVKASPSSACVFVDEVTRMRFDLSALRNESVVGDKNGKQNDFLVSICSPLQTGTCAGAAICNQSTSLGSFASVSASFQDSSLWLSFKNGSICSQNEKKNWSASIEFVCDSAAGVGSPMVVNQFSCSVNFHWKTNVVCSSLTSACSVFSGGDLYDLRNIASITHSWNFTDSENNQYWINVCNGLPAKEQHVGCPQDTTVCVKSKEGSFYALGNLETQKLSVEKTSNTIVLQYTGKASDFCSNGELPQTTLRLLCGHELGSPTFISQKNCHFEFEWKTFEACPANRKEELLEWSKGVIRDKDNNFLFNLSNVMDKVFTADEKRGMDRYTYEVVLEPNSATHTTCGMSGVCQTKKDTGFKRSIGLSNSTKIYRRGAELHMVLHSNSKCGRSQKRNNMTTTIIFQCSTEDLKNPLSFVYESMNCSYILNWKMNAVCLGSSASIEHVTFPSGSSNYHSLSTGAIFAIVGLIIFMLVVVGLLLNNQTRRAVVVTTLRRLWRRSRKSPVYRYSVLPSHDNPQNETTSLLSLDGDGHPSLQTFQDEDSDDEVLSI